MRFSRRKKGEGETDGAVSELRGRKGQSRVLDEEKESSDSLVSGKQGYGERGKGSSLRKIGTGEKKRAELYYQKGRN